MNTGAEPCSGASVRPQISSTREKAGRWSQAEAARAATTAKASPRSSRAWSSAEKLVCRYCGSDDLAPSFKKRRDARCRTCFKQRYGSASRDKQTAATRKTKATK
jgi:hypothetical protein